jgi:hypothetical protein
MKKWTTEKAEKWADEKIKLSEIKPGTILYSIASAMVRENGFYTFIRKESNRKVFVSK